jgi:hypothetical protein
LRQLAGTPKCDIALHKFEYSTVSGSGGAVKASGALMIPVASSDPTNQAASCAGARPVVLYAHGTTAERFYNIANLAESSNGGSAEAGVLAAMFAAQGFVVIAPNYAGYDTSDLDYHPYLNHDQQAKDMIDALVAGRRALGSLAQYKTVDSGKLLVTGFSQGGSVAMATQREMQAKGITYTAGGPMSGAYAVKTFVDRIFQGGQDASVPLGTPIPLGGPILGTMLLRSYQRSYGGIYSSPAAVFSSKFANGIESLIPTASGSTSSLLDDIRLPKTALFQPDISRGEHLIAAQVQALAGINIYDSTNHLITTAFRAAYNDPNDTTLSIMRQRLIENDLLNNPVTGPFLPNRPMMLCAGRDDPTVFTAYNHKKMDDFYATLEAGNKIPVGVITRLDVDPQPPAPQNSINPLVQLQAAFQQQKAAGAITTANYHGNVFPFCAAAVRGFFQQVIASNQ